jgi:transcription initiation factor IIE alpha subunit
VLARVVRWNTEEESIEVYDANILITSVSEEALLIKVRISTPEVTQVAVLLPERRIPSCKKEKAFCTGTDTLFVGACFFGMRLSV